MGATSKVNGESPSEAHWTALIAGGRESTSADIAFGHLPGNRDAVWYWRSMSSFGIFGL